MSALTRFEHPHGEVTDSPMDTPTRHVQVTSFRLNVESHDDDVQDQSLESAEDHATLDNVGREQLVDHSIEANM